MKKKSDEINFLFILFLFILIFSLSLTSNGNNEKCFKKINIRCYSYQVKQQFYPRNSVCVLTVIVSTKDAACVVWRSFLVTGACQNTKAKSSRFLLFVIDK